MERDSHSLMVRVLRQVSLSRDGLDERRGTLGGRTALSAFCASERATLLRLLPPGDRPP
jgi:hypothetical protein